MHLPPKQDFVDRNWRDLLSTCLDWVNICLYCAGHDQNVNIGLHLTDIIGCVQHHQLSSSSFYTFPCLTRLGQLPPQNLKYFLICSSSWEALHLPVQILISVFYNPGWWVSVWKSLVINQSSWLVICRNLNEKFHGSRHWTDTMMMSRCWMFSLLTQLMRMICCQDKED